MDELNLEQVTHIAKRFQERRSFDGAIRCYNELIVRTVETRHGTSVSYTNEHAFQYFQSRKPSAAAEYHRQKAVCHEQMGDFTSAIDDYVRYLRDSPTDLAVWRHFISLCSASGKLDQGLNGENIVQRGNYN